MRAAVLRAHIGVDSANAYYDPIGGFVYFAWTEATYYSGAAQFGCRETYTLRSSIHPTTLGRTWGLASTRRALSLTTTTRGRTRWGATSLSTANGDVYIATVEKDDDATFGFQRKPYVWLWDGATWTDLSLPAPSFTTSNDWVLDGENQFWDQLVMVIPYRRDGSQDGVTVFYAMRSSTTDGPSGTRFRSITIEYTPGGGWTDEILTMWRDLEGTGGGTGRANADQTRAFDPTIMWSDKLGRLVLATDLATNNEIWDMFQMNDDGDQWEILEPDTPRPPQSVRGGSRGTAQPSARTEISGELCGLTSTTKLTGSRTSAKSSPGFGIGYAQGAKNQIGEGTSVDAQSRTWEGVQVSLESTSNYRIRWAGNACYVMACCFTQPLNVASMTPDGDGDFPEADGIFIFKSSYVPCSRFLPHFYRRVLG